ncbi:aldose epimerase family protein [Lentibacillus saliphilus]|uniref:aldose epimerase family protein n=1 Tax=Lentibacillus saliphilus TaxID=2737028 RepID=UPI001C305EA2|nr:aldose epimerase family protein [Lentibacillus saliphilus]
MNISTDIIENNWKLFNLTNDNGMVVGILNYGGIIRHIKVPDRNGHIENVVLGFENIADYRDNPNYFGAIVGRVAGRIKGASFNLQNTVHHLEENEDTNHLHGGSSGFHQVIWETTPFQTDSTVGVALHHTSPDGTSGYPGEVDVTVTYTLHNDNSLSVSYEATTDQPTVLTLTNHSYFNLSGDLKETVHDHIVKMSSDHFAELDTSLLPTGRLLPVKATPFDFNCERPLKYGLVQDSNLNTTDYHQNDIVGGGYDHYFLFRKQEKKQISVREESSGRLLTISTNQPGAVMYTANALEEVLVLNGGPGRKHLGVCFETQAHPAALHYDGFPSIMISPDEPYKTETVFSFSCYD